mmetsp:Transcript_9347/g.19867  ORF Transcript_9347/g.19867 Transcript_9347/m.19867 type:complete len:92 (+) Transcript_9347:3-278(+)
MYVADSRPGGVVLLHPVVALLICLCHLYSGIGPRPGFGKAKGMDAASFLALLELGAVVPERINKSLHIFVIAPPFEQSTSTLTLLETRTQL